MCPLSSGKRTLAGAARMGVLAPGGRLNWPILVFAAVALCDGNDVRAALSQAVQPTASLPTCGSTYAEPFGSRSDAYERSCEEKGIREYKPMHSGIGYEVLDIESEACFVPDASYRLLDTLVDESIRDLGFTGTNEARATAVQTSNTIASALARHNFGLYIPTDTLGDTLEYRNHLGESERHIADCDTSSLIYLTVADVLRKPASLVEITLPSGAGHNYVRWDLGAGSYLDWDTNGKRHT